MVVGTREPRRGFTLVEMSIAAAISAMVLFALYSTLVGSSRRFRAGESGLESIEEFQDFFLAFQEDLKGPFVWNECNFPMEFLSQFGFSNSRPQFSMLPRTAVMVSDYYREHKGPVSKTTVHLLERKREPNPLAPCQVAWTPGGAWQPPYPSPGPKALRDFRGFVPIVEVVPGAPGRPNSAFVVGPSVWVFDPAKGTLYRHKMGMAKKAFETFGAGRIETFSFIPHFETYYDKGTFPEPYEGAGHSQDYVALKVRFRREAERPPLEMWRNMHFPRGQGHFSPGGGP